MNEVSISSTGQIVASIVFMIIAILSITGAIKGKWITHILAIVGILFGVFYGVWLIGFPIYSVPIILVIMAGVGYARYRSGGKAKPGRGNDKKV